MGSEMCIRDSLYGSQQLFHQLCKCVTRFSKTSLLLLPCQQWPTHTNLAILCLTLHRATGHPAFLNHATMLLCRNACPFSIMILCHHAQLLTLLSCLCAIIASKPSLYLNLQLPVATVKQCHCELATVQQCQLPVASVKQCQSHHRPNLHQFLVAGASPGSIKWRLNK